ncbi:MAG TPA: hypothetical protein VHZ26_01470 [Caulobacteraceae bacterium]|jgi:uncharacterized membrane protein|nr:hypothetical protein [Caulobacteraceae bacterium]
MFDPSQALAGFRIPSDLLIAMDNRDLHWALQPWHFIIRAVHVLSVAAFFGGIVVLDLRLMGVRATAPLQGFVQLIIPWLYGTFAVALVTGVALFLYDPVHVGSHAYFTLKLLFLALGVINAMAFHQWAMRGALNAEAKMPRRARIGGAISLILWVLVMLAASLNVEGTPKVLLSSSADTVLIR